MQPEAASKQATKLASSAPSVPLRGAHSAAAAILNTPAVSADLADLQLLDKKKVSALVGLKSTAIEDRVRARTFPEPIRMGRKCTRWTALSIKQWLQAQIEAQQPQSAHGGAGAMAVAHEEAR